MKLKYYMRGLGIGMVVTAFILSVVIDKDTKTMTDEEVLARARELGMVESTVLSQMAEQNKQNKVESKNEESVGDETDETVPEESETGESKPVESETEPAGEGDVEIDVPETEPDDDPKENENASGVTDESQSVADNTPATESTAKTVTIVIVPGESSESVCRSMEEAGVVESARELDRYLCDNGFDDRIAIGTYNIPVGATMEEIAKTITKSR